MRKQRLNYGQFFLELALVVVLPLLAAVGLLVGLLIAILITEDVERSQQLQLLATQLLELIL